MMKNQHNTWIASAIMIFSISGQALAANITWDGGVSGTGTNWNIAANWAGDVLPASGDTVTFNTAGIALNKVITLDGPQIVNQLVVTGADPGNKNYSIGAAGETLTLNSVSRGGYWPGGDQTIAASVVLATNSLWINQCDNGGGQIMVSGTISGSGCSLSKWGNGGLTLKGATLYTGGTTVGAGTLTLQNINNYVGDTTIGAGILTLNFNASTAPLSDIITNSSALKVGQNSSVTVSGKNLANVKNSQTVNGLTINPGAVSFSIANAIASGSTTLSFGAITRNAGGTVNFSQPTVNTALSADNGYATSTGNDVSGILGGYATVAGADWASNNGVNIVAYTGYTTLLGDAQNIVDGANSNVRISNASTGNVGQASATVTINTLLAKDSVARNVIIGSGNTLRLGALGGLLMPSGTGALTIDVAGSAGTLTAGGSDNTAGELVINNATTITNNAIVSDNGSGSVVLTKSGSGTLILNTASTHTGGTFLNAGSLLLPGGVNPLATNSALTVIGGTLNLGGAFQTNAATVSILGGTLTNGTIVKLGSAYVVQTGVIRAKLNGPVGLVKTSPGALTLAANNGYTGDTTVLEGSVGATVAGATKGNIVIGSSAGGLSASFAGAGVDAIADTKDVTVYRNGSFTLGGGDNMNNLVIVGGYANSSFGYINGATTMTGGTLAGNIYGNHASYNTLSNDTTALITGGNSMSSYYNHVFTVADGSAPIDLSVTGWMTGGASDKKVTKLGAGVMAVSSTGNAYSFGNFFLNAGTLLVNNTSGSGTGQSLLTVGANAVLGGTGFIGGIANYSNANVSVTGTSGNPAIVAPGSIDATTGNHIIGTLTVGNLAVQTNNVTFNAYSKLKINIATNGACDKLVVNGTLSLATATDTLEMNVADAAVLKPGTYTLVSCQQFAAGADQAFTTVVGKPARGRLEYTATSLNYVIDPKGTLITIL